MKKLFLISAIIPQLLFAQLTDDFNDGDFTSNPTWGGDTANFVVFGIYPITPTLLRLQAPAVADVSYLATPSQSINSASWEFYVELSFNPSSTNYVKVYVVSNNQNLKNSLDGYFVKIGGSTDEISLFRQDGAAEVEIIDGIDGRVNNDPVNVRVRLIRDDQGNWELSSDTTGGNNYSVEGVAFDNTYFATQFFGVSCIYTATRSTLFYFDDFDVTGNPFADTVAPELDTVTVLSSNSISVVFNEVVEKISAETILNYSVNNGIGTPLTAIRDAIDSSIVHLTFSGAFQNGITNTLTVSDIGDLSGNFLAPASKNFLFFIPDIPAYGDVIMSEIFPMPSPSVGLPEAEFVELFNRSLKVLDLKGWIFSDASASKVITNQTSPFLPGEYVILCNSTSAPDFSPAKTIGISSFQSLNNDFDSLSIEDRDGLLIDMVNYNDSWFKDDSKDDGGWTLERIDPDFPCESSDNWIASVDTSGGTPGRLNSMDGTTTDVTPPQIVQFSLVSLNGISLIFSEAPDSASAVAVINYFVDNGIGNPVAVSLAGLSVNLIFQTLFDSTTVYQLTVSGVTDCIGNALNDTRTFAVPQQPQKRDVLINELFPDPDPSVGLPPFEFIELYNRSEKAFDLNGWQIADPTSSASLPPYLVLPGDYIIVCATANAAAISPFGKVVAVNSLPSLNNTSDSIWVKDRSGLTIDFVVYSDTWYRDNVKRAGGWTLERINPEFPCETSDNWAASVNVSGGTPGSINSIYRVVNDTILPRTTSIDVVSNNSLTVTFSETLDSASALIQSNYSVDNGIGNPAGVSITGLTVTLNFTASFDTGVIYRLSVSGVQDCIGNSMNPATLIFALPQPAERFDVLITEIFPDPDPKVALPTTDFIELFNASDKAISLKDWTYSDASSSVTLPTYLLLPGDYLILCASANVADYSPFGKALGLSSFPSLNNSADTLTLKTGDGKVIFHLAYSDSWYRDAIKDDGGWTLEMIDMSNPCSGATNWRASNDVSGGTPGEVNSVNGINPDEGAPSVDYALVLDSLNVLVVFDESLDSLSGTNVANYSIDKNISVASATFTGPSFNEILLLLVTSLQRNEIYTLTVSGVTDCSGNAVGIGNTARFGIPEAPDSFDLAINEILSNPVSGGSDFIEVYNRSQKIIDLKDVIISRISVSDGSVDATVISGRGFQILPGMYVALTPSGDNIRSQYYTPNPKWVVNVPGFPSYDDDEDIVQLLNRLDNNSTIDAVHYYRDWHFALIDDRNGVSLERINYNGLSQDKNNWHSASSKVGYATPAYQNSQFGELAAATSTVSIDPKTFSPDNDGYQDILNIRYKLDQPGYVASIKIYDDAGREIRELASNQLLDLEGSIVWDGINDSGTKARIGVYIIMVELFDLSGNKQRFKESCVVAGKI